MRTLPNITSLRFFLATFVVIFHTNLFFQNRGFLYLNDFAIFKKGIEAVYIFFSLSGFLIIRQLYLEKEKSSTINLKKFFLRRIFRIFPLYYLVLIIGFVYYRFLLPTMGFEFENNYDFATGLLLSVTFFPNILYTYHPGSIIEILWSIGIEEQFYLAIAPLFFFLPLKRVVAFLTAFTVIYFLLFFSDGFALARDYQMFFFYFSFSGICSIVLLKYGFPGILYKFRHLFYILSILYFTTNYFEDYLLDFSYHLISMILFGITICLLVRTPIRLLDNKPMIYLGKISYGIYMIHSIVLQLVGLIYLKKLANLQLSKLTLFVILYGSVLLITILFSHLSYKYYEAYFLRLYDRFSQRNKPTQSQPQKD
jgi:peptidoglycan/LPS O-acetylase OafA/YrhL